MAGASLDGVKRLVDVNAMHHHVSVMCVCKRSLYRLYSCRRCKGNTHACVVKILPKPLQIFNYIWAAESSLPNGDTANVDVTSNQNDDIIASSRLRRQNQDVSRSNVVRRAVQKVLRRNVDKSQAAAADAYIVKGTNRVALPYDENDPLAKEFDVENFRCKCGKFRYNSSKTCTKYRCEYSSKDSKI